MAPGVHHPGLLRLLEGHRLFADLTYPRAVWSTAVPSERGDVTDPLVPAIHICGPPAEPVQPPERLAHLLVVPELTPIWMRVQGDHSTLPPV